MSFQMGWIPLILGALKNKFLVSSLKGAANGLAELDGDGLVPVDQLGTGSADNTVFLRGDRDWSTVSWGSVTGKPTAFAPDSHTHGAADIVSGLIDTDRLGTGTASASTLLLGNQTWAAFSTASEFRSGAANKVLTADIVYSANAPVTLTDSATITPNFNNGRNFVLTLGGNRTLANPSNQVAGQEGLIIVKQPSAGGPYTLSFGSHYKFAGTTPFFSTAANSIDVIAYFVEAPNSILCTFAVGFA